MNETVGRSIGNVIYVMSTLGHALSSAGQYRTKFIWWCLRLVSLSRRCTRGISWKRERCENERYHANMKDTENVKILYKCEVSILDLALTFIFLTSLSLQSYYSANETETGVKSMSVLSNPPFILELHIWVHKVLHFKLLLVVTRRCSLFSWSIPLNITIITFYKEKIERESNL